MGLENFLFSQTRVGQGGRQFDVYKIKTMKDGYGSKNGNAVEVRMSGAYVPDDLARTSNIGLLLRYLGLDEIPQIWNLLYGDMQMIGIRPIQPEEVEKLPDDIRAFYLSHKPGLIPGDLTIGRAEGDLSKRLENIRSYMEQATELEKQSDLHKKLNLLVTLIYRAYINRLGDNLHIAAIKERIQNLISKI